MFSGDYTFQPLGGAAPSNFYTRYIEQGLLAHTPTGTGVPPKFNRGHWKFGLKFRVRAYNFGASGSIGDDVGTVFGRLAPKIWEGKKHPKFVVISDNFRLWSWISLERIGILEIEKDLINYKPFHVGRKKFGELWSTNKKVVGRILTQPKCSYTVSWRKSIRHAVLGLGYSFRSHSPAAIAIACGERNFDYLNWLSTRTCGAGRPHAGLCPILLVN